MRTISNLIAWVLQTPFPTVAEPIFTALPDGKKLCAVTSLEVKVYYDVISGTSRVEHIATLADRCEPLVITDEKPIFYRTESDFHNGKAIGFSKESLSDIIEHGTYLCVRKSQGSFSLEGYFFNGEMPVEVTADQFMVCYHGVGFATLYADGVLLDKKNTYRNIASCLAVNPHKVVLADGTEVMRDALDRPFMLTDEQNALLDELSAVIERVKKANIALMFDSDESEIVAYNSTNATEPIYEGEAPEYDNGVDADDCIVNVCKYGRHIYVDYRGYEDHVYMTPEYVKSQSDNNK